MAKIKTKKVVTEYNLKMNQHELETLYSIVAKSSTYENFEAMRQYGFDFDENVDTPFALYEILRDALGIEED